MVTLYALMLFVLVILQIVLAVYAFMYAEELATAARNGFETLWNDRTALKSATAIDGIQQALQCCGNRGPADWSNSVPNSCCAGNAACTSTTAFSGGCGQVLFDWVRESGLIIAW